MYGPQTKKALRAIAKGGPTIEFDNLRMLYTLPPIPEGTKVLILQNLPRLSELSPFPSTLEELYIENIPVKLLPMLKECSGLKRLICKETYIESLPGLPITLEYLDCSDNIYLKELPELRNLTVLKEVLLEESRVERLETLPDSVEVLKLNFSRIKMIRNLPENLKVLECDYCPIRSLDQFPKGIQKIHLYWTLMTDIPPLPEGLLEFHYDCHMSHFHQPFPVFPLSLLNLKFMERSRTFIFQLKEGEIISDFQNLLLAWSKKRDFVRNVKRCKGVKGELMEKTWHPERYWKWCIDEQEKKFMSQDRTIQEWIEFE